MRIMIINPNTSESVTQHIREELERIRRADTQLTVVNPQHGPVSIESAYDEALAVPHVLELVWTADEEGHDAVILACFSDPGLDAARELSNIPVIGMGETTLHVAAMLGHKYSVTTTGPSRVPAKDLQTRIRNADQSYSSALAMDMSVLEMDAYPQKAKKRILELARRAIEEEGVEVLVLGCAGLAAYADDIQQQLGIVVLDPTSVAIKITEAPVDLGLRHSKVARYAQPPKKQIK